MTTRLVARWPIEPDSAHKSLTVLKREAIRDLPALIEEAGAELLCPIADLTWRIEDGELVATGPARKTTTEPKEKAA